MANTGAVGHLALNLSLNDVNFTRDLARAKAEIRDSGREWKNLAEEARQAGDKMGATEAKLNGLGTQLKQAKDLQSALNNEFHQMGERTVENAKDYDKIEKNLKRVNSQVKSFTNQINASEAEMKQARGGVDELTQSVKNSEGVYKAQVETLKSEGKAIEANERGIKGAENTRNQYAKAIVKQKGVISELMETTGKNSKVVQEEQAKLAGLQKSYEGARKDVNDYRNEKAKLESKQLANTVTEEATALKQEAKALVSSGQAMEKNGNYINGARKQSEGYKKEISALEDAQGKLSKQMDVVARTTGKSSSAYKVLQTSADSLGKELVDARSKFAQFNTGIETSKNRLASMEVFMKASQDTYRAQAKQLQDSGNKYKAMSVQVEGATDTFNRQKTMLQEQVSLLKKLENSETQSTQEIAKQRATVEKTKTSLSGYQREVKQSQLAVDKLNPFGYNKMAKGANTMYRASTTATQKMNAGFASLKSGITSTTVAMATMGVASLKGAKMATELEHTQKENLNLMRTSGESAKESQHSYNQMIKEGQALSVKYGESQKGIADGYQVLIKRGYAGNQALAAQEKLLQASKASGDSYNSVVSASTSALEQFNLRSSDTATMTKNTNKVVNEMAYAADATASSFSDLGQGMKYTGTVASNVGLSVSETSAALGVLSNRGVEAGMAGRNMQQILNRLVAPTKQGIDALNQMNLSTKDFVDKKGDLKSLTEVFGILNNKTKTMGGADKASIFKSIFGVEGQKSAAILAENSHEMGELNKEIEKASKNDYVGNLSKKNMKTVQNQLKQFKAAGDALMMMIGKEMLPVLTKMSTQMVKTFNSKEGQDGLKALAHGVGTLAKIITDMVVFMGKHTTTVKIFAGAIASIWAVKKAGDFINMTKAATEAVKSLGLMSKVLDFSGPLGNSIKQMKIFQQTTAGIEGPKTAKGKAPVAGPGAIKASGGKGMQAAGKLSGVLFSKGFRVASSAGIGAALAVIPELMSKDKNIDKAGKSAGALLGAGIGAVLGGPIGALIGGQLGSQLGGVASKSFSKNVDEATITNALKKPFRSFFDWQDAQGKASASKLKKHYEDELNGFSKKHSKQKAITIKMASDTNSMKKAEEDTKSAYNKMNAATTDYYTKQKDRGLKSLKDQRDQGVITKAEYDKRSNDLKKSLDKQEKAKHDSLKNMQDAENNYRKRSTDIAAGNDKKLLELEQKYGRNSRQYKDEQKKLQNENTRKFNTTQQDEAKKAHIKRLTDEQKHVEALDDLAKQARNNKHTQNIMEKSESQKILNDEYMATVKSINATYNKKVSAAEKQKNKTISDAKYQRDELGTISESEYQDIVKKATKKKNDTLKKAEETKNGTLKKTKKQYEETDSLIQTGNKKQQENSKKHNKKTTDDNKKAMKKRLKDVQKHWNDLTKKVSKSMSNIGKSISSKLGKIGKSISGAYTKTKKGLANFFGGMSKSVVKFFQGIWENITKWLGKLFNHFGSWVGKNLKKMNNFAGDLIDAVVGMFSSLWHNTTKFFQGIWNNMTNWFKKIFKHIEDFANDIRNTWNSLTSKIGKLWDDIWKYVGNIATKGKNTIVGVFHSAKSVLTDIWDSFTKGLGDTWRKVWGTIKNLGVDGMNAIIGVFNAGSGVINGIVEKFGGKQVIKPAKKLSKKNYAQGTGDGAERGLAMVNDGNGEEVVINNRGEAFIPQGVNRLMYMEGGETVIPHERARQLFGNQVKQLAGGELSGPQHYAKGIGSWFKSSKDFLGDLGDSIGDAVKQATGKAKSFLGILSNPLDFAKKQIFDPRDSKMSSLNGSAFKTAGGAMGDTGTNQQDKWWGTLWSMLKNAAAGGSSSGGEGDDYNPKWKSMGKDDTTDPWGYYIRECVSFVANRLSNLGVDSSLFSQLGDGRQWVSASVPHRSKPKAGDVAVYGPGSKFGNHVAIVTSTNGDGYSEEGYNFGNPPNGKYYKMPGLKNSDATTFLDFGPKTHKGGSDSDDDKKSSDPLQKLIRSQVGGMFDWVEKTVGDLLGGPENDNQAGGGVERWRGTVKRVLRELGLSTSNSMTSRVLRQINTESTGNPKAKQSGADPDGDGSGPAIGLMQTKRRTFAQYAKRGHRNIYNGYDSIYAGLNYAKTTYGSDLGFLGNGHGYENGGFINGHQIAELGEKGLREAVVPLDITKRDRAIPILHQILQGFGAESKSNSGVPEIQPLPSMPNNGSSSNIEKKLDDVLDAIQQLTVAVQQSFTQQRAYEAVSRETNARSQQQKVMRGTL